MLIASPGRTEGGYFVRTHRLLRRICDLHPGQRYILLTPEGDPLARGSLPATVTPVESRFAKRSLIHRTLWIHLFVPLFCARIGASAVLGLGCFGPRWAPCERYVLLNNARLVTPQFWSLNNLTLKTRLYVRLQRFFLGQALKGAGRIGVQRVGLISDIQRLWNIPDERFVRVPNSPSIPEADPSQEQRYHLRERFSDRTLFLFPSLYARHKNFELLVRAMERLHKGSGEGARAMICLTLDAGSQGHEQGAAELVEAIQASKARENFCFLGEVPHARMRTLFDESDVILYPSVIDSFSVIFLDAMKSGRPIVAADLPHAREACADAAAYFTWNDPDHLAAVIDHVATDNNYRETLVTRGKQRISRFTLTEEMKGMSDLLDLDPECLSLEKLPVT